MLFSVKELLEKNFKHEKWKLQLLSEWNSIVGNLADKMHLEKIEGSTLIIGVYHASWMQELYMLSTVLLQSINKHLDKPYVKKLRFKYAAPYQSKQKEKKEPVKEKRQELKKIVLSKHEEEALWKIKDTELKQALHAFLTRCHNQKVNS